MLVNFSARIKIDTRQRGFSLQLVRQNDKYWMWVQTLWFRKVNSLREDTAPNVEDIDDVGFEMLVKLSKSRRF
jgi:hypothetical protein